MNIKYLILMLMLPLYGAAQQYATFLIPDSLKENAHEVIREEYFEYEVKSEKEGTRVYRKVVTIFSAKSDADEISIFYDEDTKVKKISARIYDAFGNEVRKVDKDEIRDYAAADGVSLIQDTRVKHFEVNYSSYPYTLELEYEQSLKGMSMLWFSKWKPQSFNQSVVESVLKLKAPKDLPIHYKMLNADIEPGIENEEGQLIYTWKAQNLCAIDKEPYAPGSFYVLPHLLFGLGAFEVEGYKGSMSSWSSYSKFISDLWKDRKELPTHIADEVLEITNDLPDDKAKIEALYRYLQENMRYVSIQLGIGGLQPFSPEYVAKNKYGDCKALSNYMCCMLDVIGVDAYPALVHGGELYYDVEASFTYDAFNHVIVYVPSEDMWLECTSNTSPTGYLSDFTAGRNVLLIKETDGQLVATPELFAEDNISRTFTEVKLSSDGSAAISGKFENRSAMQDYFRAYATQASTEEQESWWLRTLSLPAFTLNQLDIEISKDLPVATLDYSGTSRTFASKAGKRIFVPMNVGNTVPEPPKSMDKRLLPVRNQKAFTFIDTTAILFPEGYQVESMNKAPIQLESVVGTYKASFVKESKQVLFIREFQFNKAEGPAEEYDMIRDFLIKAAKADKSMLVLVEKKT